MFDPTAYENMRVVIEGELYDRDLVGEISIIDRNDLINMAKLLRSYEVIFVKRGHEVVQCQLLLEARLENLAAELLPAQLNTKLAGVTLSIMFTFQHEKSSDLHNIIEKELIDIWGSDRTIQQRVIYEPLMPERNITTEATIKFERLIFEEQIDDLIDMLDYCLETLERVYSLTK